MASRITASQSGFTYAPDSTGALELLVAGSTTALSLNTAGAVGVGSTPSFGTSGQVLTSTGTGSAPQWQAGGATTGKAIAMSLIFGF